MHTNAFYLSLNQADVSRLRALMEAMEKEMNPAHLQAGDPKLTATPMGLAWKRVVDMLDLGPEPKMRACPACKHQCMLGAARCGHCWVALAALPETTSASA